MIATETVHDPNWTGCYAQCFPSLFLHVQRFAGFEAVPNAWSRGFLLETPITTPTLLPQGRASVWNRLKVFSHREIEIFAGVSLPTLDEHFVSLPCELLLEEWSEGETVKLDPVPHADQIQGPAPRRKRSQCRDR